MDGKDFKKELSTNPKNIYCLVSTDSAIIDLYVNRFKSAINADEISYGQIKIFGKLFKKKILNVIYMPKLDTAIFDRPEFIFIYTDSIDKRSSIYKQYKDRFIEVNNDYTKYIMEHSDLNENEAKHFAKTHNNDLGSISNSLTIYNLSGLCYNRFIDNSNDVYLWVNNFIKNEKLPRIIESPIGVMSLLSTNCTNLLRVKRNNTKGMNPYIVKCMYDLTKYRSENELENIISDCFYLDCQIKKGLMDINDTLKYLQLKYCIK